MSKSGESLYSDIDGEVKFVRADEFGADIEGSRTKRSCGETVPACVELAGELVWNGSYMVGTAGEEYADGNMVFVLLLLLLFAVPR